MANNRSGPPATPEQVGALAGWFKDFFRQFQLAWKLLFDPDIPWSTKLIPLVTAAYLLSPIDFIPDPALGLGQLDDLAVFLIGLRLFIDVCPPDIVEKYLHVLESPKNQDTKSAHVAEIIDIEPVLPDEEAQKKDEPEEENL